MHNERNAAESLAYEWWHPLPIGCRSALEQIRANRSQSRSPSPTLQQTLTITDWQVELAAQKQIIQQQGRRLCDLELAFQRRAEERQLQDTIKYVESIKPEIENIMEAKMAQHLRKSIITARVHSNDVLQPIIGEDVGSEVAIVVHKAAEVQLQNAQSGIESDWRNGEGAMEEITKMKKEIADFNQLQASNSQEIIKLRKELADIKVPNRESFPERESKEDAVDRSQFEPEPDKPPTHEHAKDVSEPLITAYELETNVWDLMLFCGHMEVMGIFGTLIVVFLFVANILLLWILCRTIGSPAFNSYPFPEERLSALWRWRATDGHSNLFANPEFGASLASRVCASDEGLSLSASQEQLYSSVVAYKTSGGYNLSLASIVIFVCQCLGEVRSCIWFFVAMVYLPKSWKTILAFDDEGCSISSFAYYRAFAAYLVGCCRLATVVYLCGAGCIWLANTTDIESILLNASSLFFVLELDDIFYGAFVPLSSERIFQSVKAIDIKASRVPRNIKCLLNSLPLGLLAVGTASVVIFNEMYVSPVFKDMGNIEEILCGGSLNFVYGLNIFSQVNWVPTTPPDEYTDHQHALMSVVDGMSRQTDPAFIRNTTKTHKFPRFFNSFIKVGSTRAYVEKFRTMCTDDGYAYSGSLGAQLWAISGWSQFNSSLEKCRDVVKAFPEVCEYGKFENRRTGLGHMIRFACPQACGCADATSGLDYSGQAELGCPILPCTHHIRRSIEHLRCEDSNFSSLNASANWARLARTFGAKGSKHAKNAKLLIDEGCDGISKFKPASHESQICKYIHGASSHCPVTCKCRQRVQEEASSLYRDMKDLCPPACFDN